MGIHRQAKWSSIACRFQTRIGRYHSTGVQHRSIAAANPDFPIILQWSGAEPGLGSHHSAEDFHQPILATYSRIRWNANISLVPGNGFASADDFWPYLSGDWSVDKFGVEPMPFDGVLFGSWVMIAKEAHTSTAIRLPYIRRTSTRTIQASHTAHTGAHFSYLTPLPAEFPYGILVSSPSGADPQIDEEDRSRMRMEKYIKQWEIEHEHASNCARLPLPSPFHPARQNKRTALRPLPLARQASPPQSCPSSTSETHATSFSPTLASPPLGTPSPRVQTYPCPTLGDVLSGRGIAAHFSSSHNGGGDDEVDTVGVALLRKQAKAALARTQAAKGGDSSGSAKAEPELNETLARVDGLAQRKRKAAESHADIDIMPWHRCMPATSSENGSDSLEKAVTSLFEVALPTPITSTPAFPTQPPRAKQDLLHSRVPLCELSRACGFSFFTKPVAESSGDEDEVAQVGFRVRRKRWHPTAVMTRLAPSWVRVGSFELRASRAEWESVRVLGEYTVRYLFQ
ncbi:hypothetical protein A4X03_0g7245 [Tilletia caries]|uniref:Fatty acid synthase beta subunit AflB /Fas1-like central domain-containing protein n=1 Tax=Tilletia caries TaxID=13290 RepID=A0A8T8SRB6_9BASI|nr:hypothetical protein A4X03_0g7245 [Tilletia caries]